ncbi:heat shock transcription factor, Y-linked-like [Mixophyes fleayi]|uniref:heat shock transcription factor, Y-linked-like n=1 Tax=Mixophyes fleayi TaxID=3061075 RepID=UPI003F4E09F9
MDPSAEESACIGDQKMMTNSKEVSQQSIMPSVSQVDDQAVDEIPNIESEMEEKESQVLADEPFVKKPRFLLNEDSVLGDILSLNFPSKLWKIVESDHFNSIRWEDDGICVMVHKELFKTEVLERRGPFRIFETDCMKSFIRQLNIYGFTKVRREFQRSASLAEFLAEEETAAEFNKIQLYQNPNFRRGYPDLLRQMKRRVGIRKARSAISSSELDLKGEDSSLQKCPVENRGEIVTSRGNAPKSVPEKRKRRRPFKPTPRISGSCTASSSTTTTPSEYFAMGQNASHGLDFTTTTSFASPSHMIPPMPAFPNMNPDFSNVQANLASLLSACNPWFSMNMMAAASVISMAQSLHQRSPFYHDCPSCKCFENAASASSSSTTPTKGPEMEQENME